MGKPWRKTHSYPLGETNSVVWRANARQTTPEIVPPLGAGSGVGVASAIPNTAIRQQGENPQIMPITSIVSDH